MNMRFPLLPKWAVPYSKPGINDYESNTVLTQTARIYQAMQKMIEDYNKFVDEVNTEITNFKEDVNQSMDEFEAHITKTVHDYIQTMDMKIAHQDRVIANAIEEQNKTIESNNQAQNERITNALLELQTEIRNNYEELKTYIEENLRPIVEDLFKETVEDSLLQLTYNEETEELTFDTVVSKEVEDQLQNTLGGEF